MSLIPLTGLCVYNLIENQLRKTNTIKLTANYLSSLHIVIILFSLMIFEKKSLVLNKLMIMNTIGYFFNDILFILKHKKLKTLNLIYIYHHTIVGLYMIYKPEISNTISLLLWAEISNIPTNIIYHLLHMEDKPNNYEFIKNILEYIQLFVYGIIRVFYMPYLSYYEFYLKKSGTANILNYLAPPILLMGYIYSFILFKGKYINDNKNE